MSNSDSVQEDQRTIAPGSAASVENTATPSKVITPKKKPTEVKDFEQLLRAVYESMRPRTRLKKSEILAIETAPGTGEIRSELFELAKNDLTLERTLQLMLIGASIDAFGIRARIIRFVKEVLMAHPAFQSRLVSSFFMEDAGVDSHDAAIRTLVSQKYAALPWSPDKVSLKKAQLDKCRSTAVQCFLLILWSKGEFTLAEIIEQLSTHVWRGVWPRNSSDLKLAAGLLQSRDNAAISIVYELMKRENSNTLDTLESIRIDERNAVLRAQRTEQKLSEAELELKNQSIEISKLEQKLRVLDEDFINFKALSIDEYETLRGRVLGRLRAELTLLDAGLHALRREPPKVHVMIDHAERAIDGIKSEISKLGEK